MHVYVKSEIIKTKRTSLRKMVLVIPLLCSFIAIAFGFLGGPDVLRLGVETIINHWGILWLSVFIALTAGLLDNLEKKSTRFKTIIGLPIDLKKKEISRVLFLSWLVFLASTCLIVVISIASLFIQTSPYLVPLFSCIMAVLLTLVTSLWQVPFCLWLSRKTNLFLTLLINCMLNLNLGTLYAPTEHWWLVPWAWPLRVEMPLTHLHSNGIPLPENSGLLSNSVIPIAIILSLLFWVFVTFLTAKSFEKQEVK
ncbi:lantibiotic immunity ABC transporter MutE/EpiE family permease subunit [Bacillus paranthracis]|uniref:Lantibiotic immunity ABC transporter MutE/EpiE family permease subunit n=1 Tax=Bacillus paranthracis TaxID=2026186 RepID=A0AAJ1KAT3_9BACI|nr:lantibiotic immunity ABC transporter MutE/EpiE family permease subunit [Bacillus paranthracis]MDG0949138.1 lantibiotic immunity ABC transporter MutE/EpiE family permease subunit [Bacillus paranthracis]MDG0954755.1 lantibiotic immunity ABC transporter MutE/EpiE family permease subunit [Bacillus paranthracis]